MQARPRPDAPQVSAARARLMMTAGVAGLATPGPARQRTLARRGAVIRSQLDLRGMTDAMYGLCVNPERLERVVAWAAAALSGHDVAQEIAGPARAALITAIGAEARDFAVKHRAHGHAARGLVGAALIDRICLQKVQCRAVWHDGLPASVSALLPAMDRGQNVPFDDLARVRRCLAAAEAAVIGTPA